jgi:hypothetical protein
MQIVVSDTSCMIDLRKGGLLEAMLRLPYSFVMPDTLFENEWLGLSAGEKKNLAQSGAPGTHIAGTSRTACRPVFQSVRQARAQ